MKITKYLSFAGIALALAGCAFVPGSQELDRMTEEAVKAAFRTQGIANVERVTATDETNRVCSAADVAGKPLAADVAKAIESAN